MRRKQKLHDEQKQISKIRQFFAVKMGFYILFVVLLAANIIVFAQSVSLSDQLVELEVQTRDLKKENARLEQEVFTQNSLTNLSDLADQLGFTQEAEPIYLEANEFALVR